MKFLSRTSQTDRLNGYFLLELFNKNEKKFIVGEYQWKISIEFRLIRFAHYPLGIILLSSCQKVFMEVHTALVNLSWSTSKPLPATPCFLWSNVFTSHISFLSPHTVLHDWNSEPWTELKKIGTNKINIFIFSVKSYLFLYVFLSLGE